MKYSEFNGLLNPNGYARTSRNGCWKTLPLSLPLYSSLLLILQKHTHLQHTHPGHRHTPSLTHHPTGLLLPPAQPSAVYILLPTLSLLRVLSFTPSSFFPLITYKTHTLHILPFLQLLCPCTHKQTQTHTHTHTHS